MKTLSESFAYKEEQRHGLMVDRRCGVKGRLFLFFFSKKERVSFTKQGTGFERYMAVHMGFLCSTRRDLKMLSG